MDADNQKEITINGQLFEFVKTREYAPVTVYKGKDVFVRVGPAEILNPEIDFHKQLVRYGFPVPKIAEEGTINSDVYYSETSVGDELMGDIFFKDTKKDGQINSIHFEEFLNITKQFAKAQLNSVWPDRDERSFYEGVRADIIQEELPDFRIEIQEALAKATQNTQSLPYVLTHGDLNPYNVFPKGIIDFGSAFRAPFGYDLISNVCHTYFFPASGDYEAMRRYQLTEEQSQEYFNSLDSLCRDAGLPDISNFRDDFIFLRSVWATVRMDRYPKVQQYRYAKFRQLVRQYLAGEHLSCLEN